MAEIISTPQKPRPADDFLRLQDLWALFLPKWYWFVLSVCVALGVAVFYLLSTPPLYTRTASILIKDDGKNSGGSNLSTEFQDLGLFQSNTNINNELLTLKSPTLMTEVVRRLRLNETYTVREGLRRRELYRESPLYVSFLRPEEGVGVSLTLRPTDANTVRVSGFRKGDREWDEVFSVQPGDSLPTPVGTLTVTATPFPAEWIGRDITYSQGSLKAATDAYTAALQASLGDEKSTIIDLSISDPSIRKAEDLLNTLIEVYNENWIQDKNQIAVSTSQFITDRLGVIERELGNVDENISSFKSEHLLPDVQAAASQYLSQSAENKKELLALNSQLSTVQYIRRELVKKSLTQPLPASSGLENDNIREQIGEYNAVVMNRNRLLANSSEKNPLVQDLTASLRNMQTAILQSVDNQIKALNTQIANLRTQEAATVSQLASNPTQAKYLLSVERQQKVKEELYLYLLQKREENELSQAFTAYNTRVITAPRGSAFPTAPRKSNVLLVAFAVGLLLPAAGIFLRETMNSRVRGRKDVEHLHLPFVGEIPQSGKKASRKKAADAPVTLVVRNHSRNTVNEAFRVVRTNLEFMMGAHTDSRVVMVTSINSGSGKTFISMNLAASFALKQQRILVLDLDLRRASLSRYVQSPHTGISNYLNGQVSDWRSVLVPGTSEGTPDVIPVGTLPPNPTELLFSPRMEQLIATLRSHYDYIFIDCPPVEVVADASIIARWADLTLFIVRAGLLERDMLPVIDGYYDERKFQNMALLLNGTEAAHGGRYGYRYGYHYGYGSYSEKED